MPAASIDDTMVDAIALSSPSGHMSKRARKAALRRLADRLFPKLPKEEASVSIQSIVQEAREQMNPNLDNYEIGQTVTARFTNSGRVLQFTGRIVGKTKNYWKIEAITSPWPQEQPGRIYQIATLRSRIYSANNSIQGIV